MCDVSFCVFGDRMKNRCCEKKKFFIKKNILKKNIFYKKIFYKKNFIKKFYKKIFLSFDG